MYYDHKKPDVMNWRLLEGSTLVGQFDFPKLLPVHNVHPVDLVPFNQIGTAKDKENSWFHFMWMITGLSGFGECLSIICLFY